MPSDLRERSRMQVGVFGDQRQIQRLSREHEAIGRCSERYRTAEALELTKLGGMPEDETRLMISRRFIM